MEIAAIAIQQLSAMQNATAGIMKQAQQAEQMFVQMIATNATRGNQMDISV